MTSVAESARRDVAAALALSKGRYVKMWAAFILARVGSVSHAQAFTVELEKTDPTYTMLRVLWLPTIKAATELAKVGQRQTCSEGNSIGGSSARARRQRIHLPNAISLVGRGGCAGRREHACSNREEQHWAVEQFWKILPSTCPRPLGWGTVLLNRRLGSQGSGIPIT